MRLLDTKSLEFGEFFDSDIPRYAILSHRWGENEVLYKEFKKGNASEGLGLKKVRESCAWAADHGYQWIWIDTCCIDKRSSAELSEAINSMYTWYGRSAVCLVYLSDVCYSPSDVSVLKDLQARTSFSHVFSALPEWDSLKQHFRNSSWFKRGWTLQELLAPSRLKFFDQDWNYIGNFRRLKNDISEATGIPYKFLQQSHRDASIAQRMSWASRRKTTRGEDLAYCLLGLFDINMPLLYGEGADKAFYRLQSEILRTSNDESVFAWTSDTTFAGLLASHPRDFADSGDIVSFPSHSNPRPHYTMTNRGLQISIPSPILPLDTASELTMELYCGRTTRNCASSGQAFVELFPHEGSYLRSSCHTLQCTSRKPRPLSTAEGNPDSFHAIYVRSSQIPLSFSNEIEGTDSGNRIYRKKIFFRLGLISAPRF